jgi:protein-S-isoprenylcysteine O-methyltransferase Ste14
MAVIGRERRADFIVAAGVMSYACDDGSLRLCSPPAICRLHSHHARFLFQWPTIITLIIFPILVTMYVKLARREEKEVLAEFGEKYKRYMVSTPGFLPRLSRHSGLKRA